MANKLEWTNLNLTILTKDPKTKQLKERRILRNVSGTITSGQLLAIMGPTGCGKTSLLNVLSGKIPYNRKTKLTGVIYYNSVPLDYGMSTSRYVGYVAQDEKLFSFLTVRETLLLACYFHATNNIEMSYDERNAKVEEVMRELALTKASETILGEGLYVDILCVINFIEQLEW
jgi:ABC-type multidrug transport system ATPase subunit